MFYNLGKEEVLDKLESNEKGLTEKEALDRLSRYGRNQIERKHKIHPLRLFFNQFYDPLIIILILATIISFVLGETIDAVVILIILILNAIFGFSQEYKAEKSIELLKKLAKPTCKVIRNNKEKLISSIHLVPGDIIVFEEGDSISADCRLIQHFNLSTNEAILTGESTPVNKQLHPIAHDAVIAERNNMVFSGTTVASGRGKAIVTATGMKTEMGKIAQLVQEVQETQTPLQKKLKKLGEVLGLIAVGIATLIFIIGMIQNYPLFKMFFTAIALAVAVIPEGLPAVVTITLAIGIQRMLKRKALIRKLKAVETLGSITVIASDKTGTITKNEMAVTKLYTNNKIIDITGQGFSTQGEFLYKNKKIDPKNFTNILKASASCNNAVLPNIGDPTEIALLVLATKGEIKKVEQRINEIFFNSKRKYMSTTHKIHGEEISFLKGAPEKILEFCNYQEINNKITKLNKISKNKILKINHNMTNKALRVLALAYEKNHKIIFLGLAGMIDPPRKEVKQAILTAKKAGIRTIMITGDHKNTAKAVAEQVGIIGNVVEGHEITKQGIKDILKTTNIFARVDPEHKVLILTALQEQGEIVAMTGDGINDAPALKKADVGVAMSVKGTDVARDASDMVLVDDDFTSIVHAVKEGRIIYDNIKKFVKFLLSANMAEIGVIALSLILIPTIGLPLLPLQLLWVNLITDGLPALALGTDQPDSDVMKRKPRTKKETILKGTSGSMITAGILGTAIILLLFYFTNKIQGIDMARTVALTTLICFELFFALSCRSDKESIFKPKQNKWLWLAILVSIVLHLVILYSPLNFYFKLVPLTLATWGIIILLSSLGLFVFEIKKALWHSH